MTCRILFDEHILPKVAVLLRERGDHRPVTVQEVGLRGYTDERLLEYAASQEYILLTANYRDFARLATEWNSQGRDFPGIVFVSRRSPDYEAQLLVQRIEQHISDDPQRLKNSVTWLPPAA